MTIREEIYQAMKFGATPMFLVGLCRLYEKNPQIVTGWVDKVGALEYVSDLIKNEKILTITFLLLAHLNVAGAQTGVLPSATQCEVVLSWDAPASSPDPVAGYFAFRALQGDSYSQLNETPVTVTTYTDASQLEYNSIYDYFVESVDAEGVTSAPSNIAQVPIPFVPYTPVIGGISSI